MLLVFYQTYPVNLLKSLAQVYQVLNCRFAAVSYAYLCPVHRGVAIKSGLGGTKRAEKFFLHVPPPISAFLGGPNDLSLYRPKDDLNTEKTIYMSLQTNRHIIINVNVIYVTVNYRQ